MGLMTYQFSVVKFVPDIARYEAANLGVIVVDDAAGLAESAFLADVRPKVAALAPGFNADGIAQMAARLDERASCHGQPGYAGIEGARISRSAQLATLAGAMKNQIQLSAPRPVRAASLSEAAAELYRELVHPVGAPLPEEAHVAS